jgi:hypothetical protein
MSGAQRIRAAAGFTSTRDWTIARVAGQVKHSNGDEITTRADLHAWRLQPRKTLRARPAALSHALSSQ